MARTLTSTTQTALNAGEFGVIDLVRVVFSSATLEITNAGTDVTVNMPYGSNRTFTGNGTLALNISDNAQLEFSKGDIRVTINGASGVFLTAIQAGEYIDAEIEMYKLFYTDEGNLTSGEVEQFYKGNIVGANYSITDTSSVINLSASHILYNFETSVKFTTSTSSQKLYVEKLSKYGPSGTPPVIDATVTAPRWGID
jgi:hypothetical protein